jgi:mannose-6-phosphate isomerase-like protein (cupin superfamily)
MPSPALAGRISGNVRAISSARERTLGTPAAGALASPIPEPLSSVPMADHRLTVADALSQLPGPEGERYVELFQHGTLSVELYAPRGDDPQTPHTRDEVYVVVQGGGEFVNGGVRHRFGAGDLLFVPAHVPHRFENFTADLAVWVIFYGPVGGEVP